MKLDCIKTAVVTLDYQAGILAMMATAPTALLANAAKATNFARAQHYLLIHVGLGFAEGHPEISPRSPFTQRLKQSNAFVIGTPSAQFESSIAQAADLIVYKHRVGGFSENQLDLILRSRGIENLVLLGISTSGIVLSTLRRAFDLDYRSVVLHDACFDPDAEVHRVLTEKIFPKQAAVMSTDEFINQQGA